MDYLEHRAKGVEHLRGREPSANAISHLQNGTGSREGSLRSLASSAAAQALLGWFQHGDLTVMKSWAYIAAKAQRMLVQLEPGSWWPAYIHLFPLLSNNREMIRWYAGNRVSYYLDQEVQDRDNPRKDAFHGFQAMLALQGKWSELESRSLVALQDAKVKSSKYGIDFEFHLGLARKDAELMKRALKELAGPLAAVRNFEHSFGLTGNLISTHAVVYSKIASYWGFDVNIESPWVPEEWLPMDALDSYDEPWNFMKDFDLWMPFDDAWAPWSPQRAKF